MAPCCLLQVGWGLERPRGFHLAAAALCGAVVALAALAPASDATSASLVGINYGRVGNNLPPPQSVPPLLGGLGIGRVRMYDADPAVLRTFARTGVELVVGVPDESLATVAVPGGAARWLKENVVPFLPDTKIAVVTAGNEVLTGSNSSALSRALLPALQSLHLAVAALGLGKQVAVTTAHNLGVLGTSYPPSAGAFRRDLLPYLCPILDYHAQTGSPFLVNAYPYFAYSGDPSGVRLDYALLDPGSAGVQDPGSGLRYPNLLVAQVDAVYHAIAAANAAASRRPGGPPRGPPTRPPPRRRTRRGTTATPCGWWPRARARRSSPRCRCAHTSSRSSTRTSSPGSRPSATTASSSPMAPRPTSSPSSCPATTPPLVTAAAMAAATSMAAAGTLAAAETAGTTTSLLRPSTLRVAGGCGRRRQWQEQQPSSWWHRLDGMADRQGLVEM